MHQNVPAGARCLKLTLLAISHMGLYYQKAHVNKVQSCLLRSSELEFLFANIVPLYQLSNKPLEENYDIYTLQVTLKLKSVFNPMSVHCARKIEVKVQPSTKLQGKGLYLQGSEI